MSDEDFLEFKLGEPAPNPWAESHGAETVEPKSPVPDIPKTPLVSRTRRSRSSSTASPQPPLHELRNNLVLHETPADSNAKLEFAEHDISAIESNREIDLREHLEDPSGKHREEHEEHDLGESIPEHGLAEPIREHGLSEYTQEHDELDLGQNVEHELDISDLAPSKPLSQPIETPPLQSPAEEVPPSELTPGEALPSKTLSKGHARESSHIEYYQNPTGELEKMRIDNESGAPIPVTDDDDDGTWEAMDTVGSHVVYDDKNNLVVKEFDVDEENGHNAAASGYTRVANNDDAASITSLDNKTDFLFDAHKPTDDVDAEFQMAATKSMLTDQQKIAYAGLCRLALAELANRTRRYGNRASVAVESLQIWGTKFILRLYDHLGLDNDEQVMIESLAAHNLVADDLTPCLKQIQKVTDDGKITKEVIADPPAYEEKEMPQVDGEMADLNVSELHEDIPLPQEIDRSLEVDVKWTVLCDLFLILLADGEYDSRARTLLELVAGKLNVKSNEVAQFERKVTDVLQIDDNADQDWTEEDIIEARRRKLLRKKYAYVGLATVGGGLVIGLSGGLLAPVVGAGLAGALGTIGIAGTGGFLAGVGGTAIITTASTAIGARVGSKSMLRRVGHVKTFEFRPIFNNNRVNLVIAVSGWMTGKDDDVRLPFSTIDPLVGDVMSVLWEPEMMRSLGQTISIFATEALAFGVQQILAATVFSMLMASLTAPMWLSKLSYLVDNPWSVSLDRAWAAGIILAETLIQRKLGQRPATLVGYSLGARVIYSCIHELSRRKAFGLVQDVFLFGTPVFYNKKQCADARSVVSGRFVNGYSRNDWILAFLFPAAKRYGSVLGLDTVPDADSEQFDIENIDVSELVDGHMSYRGQMPKILKLCGWSVLSEEFDEIEDPDPEHTREKQLKLLNELETAEQKPKKTGFFSGWNLDWMQRAKPKAGSTTDNAGSAMSGPSLGSAEAPMGQGYAPGETLFDVDALRTELESLKPRMVFEQEPMPLPERDEGNIPLELLDTGVEPAPPTTALDYDEQIHKPAVEEPKKTKPDEKQPQLHFDDLE